MKLFPFVLIGLLWTLFACDEGQKVPRVQPAPPVATPQPTLSLTLEVVKPLALVSLGGTVDIQLEAKGEVDEGTLVWSLTGEVPAGLELKSTGRTAALKGVIRKSKTYIFSVSVKDGQGKTDNHTFTLEVPDNPILIETKTLPAALQGQAYSTEVEAKGGVDAQYTWKLDEKDLPKDFTTQFKDGKLIVNGSTKDVGTFTLHVLVRNTFGQESTQTLTLAVNSTLKIIQNKVSPGTQNEAYTQKLTVEGGKGLGFTWNVTSGTLPKGVSAQVSADSSSWTLSGQPQETGIFNVQVRVTDATSGQASTDLTLDIRKTLAFVALDLPDGKAGTPYKTEIQVEGGLSESYVWKDIYGLPSEIKASYDNKKGTIVLEGTPLEPGSQSFTVEISDSRQTLSRRFYLYVRSTPPVILTENLPDVSYGENVQLLIQGRSLQMRSMYWKKDDSSLLPPGLWLEDSSAAQVALSGYTMYPGTYTFTLSFGDNQGSSQKAFQLRVLPPKPEFALLGRSLPQPLLDQMYEADLFTKNGRIKSFAVEGQLPEGIQLQQADDNILRLKGVVKEAGFFLFKIRVQSLSGATAEGSYALAVVQNMDWMVARVAKEGFLVNKYDVSKRIPLNDKDLLLSGLSSSPNGRWVAYTTAKTPDGWEDLYLVDLAQPERIATHVSSWVGGTVSWSPDSSRLVFYSTNGKGDGGMRVYDLPAQTFLKGSGIMAGASSSSFVNWDLAGQKFTYCSRYDNEQIRIANLTTGEIQDESILLHNLKCRTPKFGVQTGLLFLDRDVVRFENYDVIGEARFTWGGAMSNLVENPSRLIVSRLNAPFLEFVWNSKVPSEPRSFVIEGEAHDWDRFGLSRDENTVFVQRGKETYSLYGAVLTRELISPQPIENKEDHPNIIMDFANASEGGHTIVHTESGYYDMDLSTLQRRRIADSDALRVVHVFERAPASSFFLVKENANAWTLRSYQNPMNVLQTISSTADYIQTDPWNAFALVTPNVLSYFGVFPAKEQPLDEFTSKRFMF